MCYCFRIINTTTLGSTMCVLSSQMCILRCVLSSSHHGLVAGSIQFIHDTCYQDMPPTLSTQTDLYMCQSVLQTYLPIPDRQPESYIDRPVIVLGSRLVVGGGVVSLASIEGRYGSPFKIANI